MQDKKLIAFDLFDTCMEFTITKPQENQEYDKLFANLGILERKREIQKILLTTNRDIENIIKDMIPGTNIDDFLKIYYQHIKKELASVELFPETKNTLSKIRDKGYKIAVISNISKPYTQALYRLLPYIFDYEVLSCNV